MNGKRGSNIGIDVLPTGKDTEIEIIEKKNEDDVGFSFNVWIVSVWEFCKEDKNRVIFSLKVGFAVLLVSLLILLQAPYEVFGNNIIWSILTVAIMFEYTVGATFNRGFNRALGSLLAGIFAIGVAQLALFGGRVAEPIIIGIGIFFIGALTSFLKLWPSLSPYEYGFRVILFTFCLIIVSGYRMGSPVRTAMERLYSIGIGGFVAVLVNILVFPIWAGEQLQKELVKDFDSVADSLEECVRKYLEDDGSDQTEFSKTVLDEFPDEPAYRRCKATLNSSTKLEALANSAKWEPPHGRFRHCFYPYSEYVKVGAVLRYCAYEVMALHGVLHSEIQAPYNLRISFQFEIMEASSQAAELVRSLGKDINNMKHSPQSSLLKKVHSSTERLQRAIDMHSYLLTSSHQDHLDATKSFMASRALSRTASSTLNDNFALSKLGLDRLETPNMNDTNTSDQSAFSGTLVVAPFSQAEYSYHEAMKKQQRRLHSWPSREVDGFEDESGFETDFIPRMKALESTTSLSLSTFTSLLIEFVARLDHLVAAVKELAEMAKFKHDQDVRN